MGDWDLAAAGGHLRECHSHHSVGSACHVDRWHVHLCSYPSRSTEMRRSCGLRASANFGDNTQNRILSLHQLASKHKHEAVSLVIHPQVTLTLAEPRSHDRLNERDMHMSSPFSQTCSPLTWRTVSSTLTLSSFGAYLCVGQYTNT